MKQQGKYDKVFKNYKADGKDSFPGSGNLKPEDAEVRSNFHFIQ